MELFDSLSAAQIAIVMAAAFAAAFVRGLAGFGLALLLVPVLALAMMPVEAVMIANFLMLFIGLLEIRTLIRDAERSAWVIGGLVVLTTAPGLLLLMITPPDLARLLIALVALGAFGLFMLPERPADQPGPVQTGATGVAAGLLTGFAGMPGPPVVPYYVGRAIPRTVAKPSMLLIFSIASAAAIVSGFALGQITTRLFVLSLVLMPAIILGNWVGAKAFGKVSDAAWRIFAGAVLTLAAATALLRVLS
ncbi:MAG: TSUP family transporter [Marinomonas sp.]